MRGDHAPFPLDIGIGERHLHRVRFQQQAKLGEIPQVLGGDRRHLKAAPPLGQHETLRGEPVQDFAQRGDADAVILLEALKPELLTRAEPAEHDVGPDAAIAVIADRFLFFRPLDQCHCQSMRQAANSSQPASAMSADSTQALPSILYSIFHMIIVILYFDFAFII